jgi:hypothetical protein
MPRFDLKTVQYAVVPRRSDDGREPAQLSAVRLGTGDYFRDFFESVAEYVAEQEDGSFDWRQTFKEREESDRDGLVHLDTLGRIRV